MKITKNSKSRDPIVRVLRTPQFRKRVVPNKKKYDRAKQKAQDRKTLGYFIF